MTDSNKNAATLTKIKDLTMTCEACPSQWEGHAYGGLGVYIRYRWGTLTAVLHDGDKYRFAKKATTVYEIKLDDNGIEGVMLEKDMISFLDSIFDFSEVLSDNL